MTGWALEAICLHLEAVARGVRFGAGEDAINRLLMNVPPGFMKSLATDVFFPAWIWGPQEWPSARFMAFSYSAGLTERDNQRFAAIVSSRRYQELWGHIVTLPTHALGVYKVANKQTGWKIASSVGGMGTGERADFVIIDDPHNVKEAESEKIRMETVRWFRESITSRMNDPLTSAIIVIMQRVNEGDVSGVILDEMDDYTQLCITMEFDWLRPPTTIGWEDPRSEIGELAFPDRFPREAVDRDKRAMGPNAVASQFQQSPAPRGGGIIKRDWWQLWDGTAFPPFDYIIASLDTAYTEKTENDYSAMVVLGVFYGDTVAQVGRILGSDGRPQYIDRSYSEGAPKVMLMAAWQERLELHDLVNKVADTAKKLKVDKLLVENKAAGHSVAQEIRRLYNHETFATQLDDPKRQDKTARLYSIQAIFSSGMVYAPDRQWVEMVINQVATFPKAKHDDLTDALTAGVRHLRDLGLLAMKEERIAEIEQMKQYTGKGPAPLYPV